MRRWSKPSQDAASVSRQVNGDSRKQTTGALPNNPRQKAERGGEATMVAPVQASVVKPTLRCMAPKARALPQDGHA